MTTENTAVSTVSTTTVPKTPRVRPAVQSRKAVVMDALKTLLADGKPRGPSEIARDLNASGLTDLGVWTDAYHMLKSSGVFGVTFIEGAKRARYFLPTAAVPAATEVAPLGELNAEIADLVAGLEEVAPITETVATEPEAQVAEPVAPVATKKNKKAKKDATPAVEAPVADEAKAA